MASVALAEKNDRRSLASELLGLHRKHGADFARMEDLKRALREMATKAGESFKEEFAGKGAVKVSGEKEGTFKGRLPIVNAEAFFAMTDKQREDLDKRGVVKLENVYGKKFYGSVTVDVF